MSVNIDPELSLIDIQSLELIADLEIFNNSDPTDLKLVSDEAICPHNLSELFIG